MPSFTQTMVFVVVLLLNSELKYIHYAKDIDMKLVILLKYCISYTELNFYCFLFHMLSHVHVLEKVK
jgi:hypothetical protein